MRAPRAHRHPRLAVGAYLPEVHPWLRHAPGNRRRTPSLGAMEGRRKRAASEVAPRHGPRPRGR
eukprot:9473541-Pyramimonas_sp.AAC.1